VLATTGKQVALSAGLVFQIPRKSVRSCQTASARTGVGRDAGGGFDGREDVFFGHAAPAPARAAVESAC